MVKEIPILMSTPMVQAILAERKTQTRRIVKTERNITRWFKENRGVPGTSDFIVDHYFFDGHYNKFYLKCPYGRPGDVLWVRESFNRIGDGFEYKADNGRMINGFQHLNIHDKYKPSIHMPKAAARIWLEVVNVRVEHLQSISENDAIEEGVEMVAGHYNLSRTGNDWRNYLTGTITPTAGKSFMSLWFKLNGVDTWHTNPWVWVVEFKKVDKPQRP